MTQRVLVVAARLENESHTEGAATCGDGLSTRIGTFQKLYSHAELGSWIRSLLIGRVEALGPGIYCVFRHEEDASEFEARRFRRVYLPRVDHTEAFLGNNGDLLGEVLAFVQRRGRLPLEIELADPQPLVTAFGSVKRGLAAIRRRLEDETWAIAERARIEDLVITIALARFKRRPKLGELPLETRADIHAFFTSYHAACALADELLFALGDPQLIERACRQSKLGKLTPTALYVHRDWLHQLSPILRLYEGCARAWLGSIEGEVIKLHYEKACISYLHYPDFDDVAHPSLHSAATVGLKHQTFTAQSYLGRAATPILHRKERFLSPQDPRHAVFSTLTKQEEAAGLFENPTRIGLSTYWEALLAEKKLVIRGHRLSKLKVRAS